MLSTNHSIQKQKAKEQQPQIVFLPPSATIDVQLRIRAESGVLIQQQGTSREEIKVQETMSVYCRTLTSNNHESYYVPCSNLRQYSRSQGQWVQNQNTKVTGQNIQYSPIKQLRQALKNAPHKHSLLQKSSPPQTHPLKQGSIALPLTLASGQKNINSSTSKQNSSSAKRLNIGEKIRSKFESTTINKDEQMDKCPNSRLTSQFMIDGFGDAQQVLDPKLYQSTNRSQQHNFSKKPIQPFPNNQSSSPPNTTQLHKTTQPSNPNPSLTKNPIKNSSQSHASSIYSYNNISAKTYYGSPAGSEGRHIGEFVAVEQSPIEQLRDFQMDESPGVIVVKKLELDGGAGDDSGEVIKLRRVACMPSCVSPMVPTPPPPFCFKGTQIPLANSRIIQISFQQLLQQQYDRCHIESFCIPCTCNCQGKEMDGISGLQQIGKTNEEVGQRECRCAEKNSGSFKVASMSGQEYVMAQLRELRQNVFILQQAANNLVECKLNIQKAKNSKESSFALPSTINKKQFIHTIDHQIKIDNKVNKSYNEQNLNRQNSFIQGLQQNLKQVLFDYHEYDKQSLLIGEDSLNRQCIDGNEHWNAVQKIDEVNKQSILHALQPNTILNQDVKSKQQNKYNNTKVIILNLNQSDDKENVRCNN